MLPIEVIEAGLIIRKYFETVAPGETIDYDQVIEDCWEIAKEGV